MGLRVHVPSSVPIFVITCFLAVIGVIFATFSVAGWSSLVARWAHNPKVVGSNPAPATKYGRKTSETACSLASCGFLLFGPVRHLVRHHELVRCSPPLPQSMRRVLLPFAFRRARSTGKSR